MTGAPRTALNCCLGLWHGGECQCRTPQQRCEVERGSGPVMLQAGGGGRGASGSISQLPCPAPETPGAGPGIASLAMQVSVAPVLFSFKEKNPCFSAVNGKSGFLFITGGKKKKQRPEAGTFSRILSKCTYLCCVVQQESSHYP